MKKVIIFSTVVLVIGAGTWLYFRQRSAKLKGKDNSKAPGTLPVPGTTVSPTSEVAILPATTPAPTGELIPPVSEPVKTLVTPSFKMPTLWKSNTGVFGSLYQQQLLYKSAANAL